LTNCCVWGNAYALKTTGQDGMVTAMTPLHPLYVTPRELESGEIVFDYYAADGQQSGRFTSRQVIHIRYLSDNGWKGLCPLNLLAPVIKLARLMDIASQRFWNNDARPSVILESSQPIPEPAMKTLARSWNTMFKGPLNTGKTCVLPNGITAREFAPSSAVDSDLVAVRQFLVEEIARGMRVPASMIGGQGGSYEDDMLRFTQQTVTPWVNRMESAFQRGLFNQEEELNNQIDVRGMMRGDSSSRANYYASLFNMAAMSPNDVRRAEELPPLETEAADNTYIPLNNFSPLQIAAQQGLKATGEGTADEPQEEEPTNARKKATRKKATPKKSTKARTPRPSSK
jgi:HK97 family phage portal protein